ncbi:MAG: hypothetical protein IJ692_06080 [Alloprevotella sp.]|nr:hypothetical protein [Alloprevotella sp.]
MKRTITIVLALLAGGAMRAQEDVLPSVPDTLTDVRQASRVLVTESDSTIRIDIEGTASDSSFHYTYRRALTPQSASIIEERADSWNFTILTAKPDSSNTYRELKAFGLLLGWVATPGAPQGREMKLGRSMEAYIDLAGPFFTHRRHTFGATLGFSYRGLTLSNSDLRFSRGENVNVSWQPYPENTTRHRSILSCWSNYLHAGYYYRLGHGWTASVHGFVHYNWRAWSQTHYRDGIHHIDDTVKNTRVKRFAAEAMVGLSYHGVGLYAKYRPTKVLCSTEDGANFRMFSFGMSLAF